MEKLLSSADVRILELEDLIRTKVREKHDVDLLLSDAQSTIESLEETVVMEQAPSTSISTRPLEPFLRASTDSFMASADYLHRHHQLTLTSAPNDLQNAECATPVVTRCQKCFTSPTSSTANLSTTTTHAVDSISSRETVNLLSGSRVHAMVGMWMLKKSKLLKRMQRRWVWFHPCFNRLHWARHPPSFFLLPPFVSSSSSSTLLPPTSTNPKPTQHVHIKSGS